MTADRYVDTPLTIMVPPALVERLGLPRRPEHPELLAELLGPDDPTVTPADSPNAA